MPQDAPEVLSDRLLSLERRQRLLMVIVAVLGLVLVWRESAPREFVRARNFVLIDEEGMQRGIWRVRDTVPKLILQNTNGVWKAVLGVDDGGGTLELYGPGGDSSIRLTATQDTPRLELRNAATQQALSEQTLDGVPLVELAGPAGRVRRIRSFGRGSAADEEGVR